MNGRHHQGIAAGETALTGQIRACIAEMNGYWQNAAAWDLPPAPDLAAWDLPPAPDLAADLMAARALLFRALALLMAIETVTS